MNLWGNKVTESKPVKIEVPYDRDLLITRVALGPGTSKAHQTYLYLVNHDQQNAEGGDESFVIGTLRAEHSEQFEVDINVASGSTLSFRVKGPGEIHLTGYYNRLQADSDDDENQYDSYSESFSSGDEENSEEEDSDLEARINRYMGGEDSSSGEDYQEEGQVETASESDSDMDDEGQTKSPVKQKTTESTQILPKVLVNTAKAETPKPQASFKVSGPTPTQSPLTANPNKKKKKKKNLGASTPTTPSTPSTPKIVFGTPNTKAETGSPFTPKSGFSPNSGASPQSDKKKKPKKKRLSEEQEGNSNKKQKTQ